MIEWKWVGWGSHERRMKTPTTSWIPISNTDQNKNKKSGRRGGFSYSQALSQRLRIIMKNKMRMWVGFGMPEKISSKLHSKCSKYKAESARCHYISRHDLMREKVLFFLSFGSSYRSREKKFFHVRLHFNVYVYVCTVHVYVYYLRIIIQSIDEM